MPNHALIRGGVGSGAWDNLAVGHAYFEALDAAQADSISETGGAYAPSDAGGITIGGTGLTCDGQFSATDTADFTGTCTFSANTATFNGSVCALVASSLTVDATSNITIAASGIVACHGAMSFPSGASLTTAFGCTATFNGQVQLEGTTFVDGLLNINNSVTIAATAPVSLASIVTPTGVGRVRKKRIFVSSDANFAISIGTADVLYQPAGIFTNTRVVTINDTGAGDGDILRVYSADGSFGMDLRQANGTPIGATVVGKGVLGSGEYQWVDLMYLGTGSSWTIIGGSKKTA